MKTQLTALMVFATACWAVPATDGVQLKVGHQRVRMDALQSSAPLSATVEVCAGCHGENGAGDADFGRFARWGTPDLRGQSPKYLREQMLAYRSGARSHHEMAPLAQHLDLQRIDELVMYYAALPAPTPLAESAPGWFSRWFSRDALDRGKAIAEQGLTERGVPACASCHGEKGVGIGDTFPRLAGQNEEYIQAAFQQMVDGKRNTPSAAAMAGPATALSSDEIEAVARYYAGFVPR
ncbi:MAG: c-type cytochrome [Myxococcota bacterium]